MMENPKIKLVSGQFLFEKLTSELDEQVYKIAKLHIWLQMLESFQMPKKWFNATGKGTKVTFDYIYTKEEFDSGIVELELFIDVINKQYGTTYSLNPKQENEIIESFRDYDFSGIKLPMISVYEKPDDFKDKFVARLFDVDQVTTVCIVKDTLEEIYECIPYRFDRLERTPEDDEKLVCVFV